MLISKQTKESKESCIFWLEEINKKEKRNKFENK